MAKVIKTRADSGKPWTEFFPNVPEHFCSFVKVCACASLRNALAQIQVLSSDVPLEKLAEDTESQECLD